MTHTMINDQFNLFFFPSLNWVFLGILNASFLCQIFSLLPLHPNFPGYLCLILFAFQNCNPWDYNEIKNVHMNDDEWLLWLFIDRCSHVVIICSSLHSSVGRRSLTTRWTQTLWGSLCWISSLKRNKIYALTCK